MRGKVQRQKGGMVMDCERICTEGKVFGEVRGTWHQLWESLWFYFQQCQQQNRTQIKCILLVSSSWLASALRPARVNKHQPAGAICRIAGKQMNIYFENQKVSLFLCNTYWCDLKLFFPAFLSIFDMPIICSHLEWPFSLLQAPQMLFWAVGISSWISL